MAVNHVQMTLVHRQVDGLDDGAARVVQRRRHVGQLHEVLEVLEARVAAPFVQAANERRAVSRGEHGVAAADAHIAGRVAGVLGELAGGAGLHDAAAHAARELHQFAGHFGARGAQDIQRFGVFAELDAHFGEDGVGIALDNRQPIFAQHLVVGHGAGDVGHRIAGAGGTGGALGFTSIGAGAALRGWLLGVHRNLLVFQAASMVTPAGRG